MSDKRITMQEVRSVRVWFVSNDGYGIAGDIQISGEEMEMAKTPDQKRDLLQAKTSQGFEDVMERMRENERPL